MCVDVSLAAGEMPFSWVDNARKEIQGPTLRGPACRFWLPTALPVHSPRSLGCARFGAPGGLTRARPRVARRESVPNARENARERKRVGAAKKRGLRLVLKGFPKRLKHKICGSEACLGRSTVRPQRFGIRGPCLPLRAPEAPAVGGVPVFVCQKTARKHGEAHLK